ncbi:MAG: hypothetical protein U5R31_04615 [Acidimicrobiia bacterium]|nr:hypothetical protein [Acidimicrobiia bacterium]
MVGAAAFVASRPRPSGQRTASSTNAAGVHQTKGTVIATATATVVPPSRTRSRRVGATSTTNGTSAHAL